MNALAKSYASHVTASPDPFDPRNLDRSDMAETQRLARVDDEARMILADSFEQRGLGKLADTTRRRDVSYASDPTVLAEIYAAAGRDDIARLWRDELPKREHRTRKRVDKMTADESAQMKSWADKWIKIGLSTARADRPLFEAAVTACYRYSGLAAPKAIVWAPCPIVVAYAGSIANNWLKANWDSLAASRRQSVPDDSVRDSVGDSVRDSVDDSVRASVGASVRASVHDSVHDSVGASVHDSVRASVRASVHDSVRASVRASVHDSVRASVRDSVREKQKDRRENSNRDGLRSVSGNEATKDWYLYQGGQFWVGWGWSWRGSPSYVSFMLDALRLDIGRDQELKARAYAATHESACWWWPHRDFVIVSERPTLIEKHPNGKLKVARWEWVDRDGAAQSWEVRK